MPIYFKYLWVLFIEKQILQYPHWFWPYRPKSVDLSDVGNQAPQDHGIRWRLLIDMLMKPALGLPVPILMTFDFLSTKSGRHHYPTNVDLSGIHPRYGGFLSEFKAVLLGCSVLSDLRWNETGMWFHKLFNFLSHWNLPFPFWLTFAPSLYSLNSHMFWPNVPSPLPLNTLIYCNHYDYGPYKHYKIYKYMQMDRLHSFFKVSKTIQ